MMEISTSGLPLSPTKTTLGWRVFNRGGGGVKSLAKTGGLGKGLN